MLHPTAIVDAGAKIPDTCSIGPYCVVGPDVELGEHCELMSHVTIHGPSKIGSHNRFFPSCAIGLEPQDVSFRGEKTCLEMGDHNVIRECVTLNRGTAKGGGVTRVGSYTLIMAYSHVGHDTVIGDRAMLINGATLAGHVIVEEWAVVGALCCVHQFVRIGAHSYIGGGTVITQDVLPFSLIVTERETKCFGANTIGLERKGFSPERIQTLQRAFKLLVRSKKNTTQALEEMQKTLGDSADVQEMIEFVEKAERGIIK